MNIAHLLLVSFLPALVITAALKDLTTMTIPNWISGALILAFIPTAWLAGLTPVVFAGHVAISFCALLIGMGLFAGRVIGGGDAKLMATSALWLGMENTGLAALWIALLGGLFCMILIMARQNFRPYVIGMGGWVSQLLEPKGDIPYGVAIAAGVLMAFPASPIAIALTSGG